MKRDVVVFKGTKQGLLIILDAKEDFDIIKERLAEKLLASGDFFSGAKVYIDTSGREFTPNELEELKTIIEKENNLTLVDTNPSDWVKNFEKKNEAYASNISSEDDINNITGNTLLIKRTIRSGQRINFAGNIVIMGDVNPGSEIVAGGDIIVLGSFRGVAHAGATGNENSVVMAFKLQPTQLRIANFITRPPDGNQGASKVPEIAQIKDGNVIIRTYALTGENL